jgi:hypothetical protein
MITGAAGFQNNPDQASCRIPQAFWTDGSPEETIDEFSPGAVLFARPTIIFPWIWSSR